jgi:hypothetical protein
MRVGVVLAALTLICAPLAAQDTVENKPKKPKRQPNVISLEEIEAVRDQTDDAMGIIQRLRPQYLRARGATSLGNAAGGRAIPYARVVVDGMPRGELSVLTQIPAMTVKEIRYLGASEASVRFGTGYDGGAILVTTR